jgi:predicted nucleic acid-binding protein
LSVDERLLYLDASALVKLVVDEAETVALKRFLRAEQSTLTTSAVSIAEVARACAIADPSIETQAKARRFVDSCDLIGIGEFVLRSAAQVAPRNLRTLDAIHLVSAQLTAPKAMVVYDRRLRQAAEEAGLAVVSPGI